MIIPSKKEAVLAIYREGGQETCNSLRSRDVGKALAVLGFTEGEAVITLEDMEFRNESLAIAVEWFRKVAKALAPKVTCSGDHVQVGRAVRLLCRNGMTL
jgi:hypothetical protein